jgi:hypothetical protein
MMIAFYRLCLYGNFELPGYGQGELTNLVTICERGLCLFILRIEHHLF